MRGGTEPSTLHAKIRTLALLLVLNMLLARCRRRRLFIIIRYRRLIGDILHLKLILLFLQLILTINCAKSKGSESDHVCQQYLTHKAVLKVHILNPINDAMFTSENCV